MSTPLNTIANVVNGNNNNDSLGINLDRTSEDAYDNCEDELK